jgi:hypothetical protein
MALRRSLPSGHQQSSRPGEALHVCSHLSAPLPTAWCEIRLAPPVGFEQREEHFVAPGPAHTEIAAQ